MTDAASTTGASRPRRWWLALILNLVTFPAGYAYVGARRLAMVSLVLTVAAAVLLLLWTYAFPPGLYRWNLGSLLIIGWPVGLLFGGHAAWLARRAPPVTGSVWKHGLIYLAFWLSALTAMLGLRMVFPLSTYAFAASSMEPSLSSGDVVAVKGMRAACGPVRPTPGDVVVYRQPGRGSVPYMQRVVAGPGQTVAMKDGRLWINGAPVRVRAIGDHPTELGFKASKILETLPNGVSYGVLDLGPGQELDTMPTRRLGPDQWFILGDNRDNSLDSRFVGPIGASQICGVALRVLQSEDKSRVGAKP